MTDVRTAPAEIDEAGLAVGLWRHGQPVLRRFTGLARRDTRAPVDADTGFDIASVSKMFTGLGVLMLIEDGLIAAHDRLGAVLPVMREAAGAVTIRQLLDHTAGLPDYMDLFEQAGLGIRDPLGMAETLDMLSRQPPPTAPGQAFGYSNTGYVLLAAVIEHVTGQSHAAFTKARIFDPLGMSRTHLIDRMPPPISHAALSYDPTGVPVKPLWTMTGDGQIHATLDDLARWSAELIAPQIFPSLIAQLVTPGRLRDGTLLAYGAGVRHERLGGQPVLGHEGGWAGFRSSLLVMPSRGLAAIVLANQSDTEAGEIARAMLGAA